MADVVGGGTLNVSLYDEYGTDVGALLPATLRDLVHQTPITPFEERLTADRTPLFNLSSTYPLTSVRDIVTGAPQYTGAEYRMWAGDKIESAEIGRYVPGYSAEMGIGIRVVVPPSAGQKMRWGYYDSMDGFFFEHTTEGLFVVLRRDGIDTRVSHTEFNGDPLLPTLEKGNIFQVRYTWYGYGQIEYRYLDTNPAENQHLRLMHRTAPGGGTSIRNPNLPITAEIVGAGTGEMCLAGRQFSIIGKYVPQTRTHSLTRTLTGIGTAWTPVVAFRRKDTEDAKRVKLRVDGHESICTGDTELAIVVNPTMTFGTPVVGTLSTVVNSAVEFSVNPSNFSLGNGNAVIVNVVRGGTSLGITNGLGASTALGVAIPRRFPAVLVARSLGGGLSTTDVTALIRSLEEW